MDFLTAHAGNFPNRAAVVFDGQTITFAELEEKSNRLANALQGLGLRSLDRATTVGYNSPSHFVVNAASRKLVLVSLPMNYRLTEEEVRYQLVHSQSKAIFAGPEHVERVAAICPDCPALEVKVSWSTEAVPKGWRRLTELIALGSPEPPAVEAGLTGPSMTYTAGTTGNPKGAYRAQGTDPSILQRYMQWFDLRPGDVHLVAGPMYHSAPGAFAGFNTIFGGTNVLMRRFDPEQALALIEQHRVSSTFMAPILLQRIVRMPESIKRKYDLSSLHSIVVAAAPCPHEVKRAVIELFGEVLYEFYGSSEVGCNTVLKPSDQLRKPGSCGQPVEGIEIKVFGDDGNELGRGEPGELFIKSPQVITEYWRNEEATQKARNGDFFSVGDVGYFDDEGFLYVVDRKRDMVISGGVNINTTEIENLLYAHPGVFDAAVFGIPNEEWGESVHAVVQPREEIHVTPGELAEWLRHQLADYKMPRSWELRALPRDEAGKIRKRELREPFWKDRATRV